MYEVTVCVMLHRSPGHVEEKGNSVFCIKQLALNNGNLAICLYLSFALNIYSVIKLNQNKVSISFKGRKWFFLFLHITFLQDKHKKVVLFYSQFVLPKSPAEFERMGGSGRLKNYCFISTADASLIRVTSLAHILLLNT